MTNEIDFAVGKIDQCVSLTLIVRSIAQYYTLTQYMTLEKQNSLMNELLEIRKTIFRETCR